MNILILSGPVMAVSIVKSQKGNMGNIWLDEQFSKYYKNEQLYENSFTKFFSVDSISKLEKLIKEENISFAIVINHVYENLGLVNYIKYNLGIPTFGITRYWMQLETSKLFAKEFMTKHNIQTSNYKVVKSLNELQTAILEFGFPIVLKDNNLQSGFGSYILKDKKECLKRAKKLLKQNKFFIVEKFIEGREVTLHTLWDGKVLLPLAPVRDYKRLKNNDEGINTASMGSYVPVSLSENQEKMIDDYVKKIEQVFKELNPTFTGMFASDLIFTEDKLYNLEFNMRPCTPEFEVLLEHMENDGLELLYKTAKSELESVKITYKEGITGVLNVFHKDYEKHLKRVTKKKIKLPSVFFKKDKKVKIAGALQATKKPNEFIINSGVRALAILKNDINDPFVDIYEYADKIEDKNLHYRTDIGKTL